MKDVRFHGILIEDHNNYEPKGLVMELGSNGSLYQYIRNHKNAIDWPLCLRIAKDLTAGLAYLHDDKKIIHQDIKSLNVVLDEKNVAKWCDFGLAKLKLHTSTYTTSASAPSTAGTLRWLAPERLKPSGKASFPADIWALGMVFMEIITGDIPFAGTTDDNMIKGWIREGETGDIPEECSKSFPDFAEIVQSCMQKDPTQRPTAKDLFDKMHISLFVDF
jgi:serine/threonine protein kinase